MTPRPDEVLEPGCGGEILVTLFRSHRLEVELTLESTGTGASGWDIDLINFE